MNCRQRNIVSSFDTVSFIRSSIHSEHNVLIKRHTNWLQIRLSTQTRQNKKHTDGIAGVGLWHTSVELFIFNLGTKCCNLKQLSGLA